ncbi:Serine/threonine-protein kinase plk1 [Chytriomyces hyalinus]|nr:Serine/threonine-protein kinase plk1 [Chytriomyces hyalinus]
MDKYWPTSRIHGLNHIWNGKDTETGEEVVLPELVLQHPTEEADKNLTQVVMKLADIERDSDYQNTNESVEFEAHALKTLTPLNPKRIINFKAFYRNQEGQYVIVMEKAVSSLEDVLQVHKRLSEQETKLVVHAILEGLATAHKSYIVHRDIKPANLFLFGNDLNSLKIGDWGIAAEDNGYSCVGGMKGTKGYMAPEILKKVQYGRPVDIWGTGVIAFQLLFGSMPFPDVKKRFAKAPKLAFPYNVSVSVEAQDFIKLLLAEDPSDRPTAQAALSHPWMKSLVIPQTIPEVRQVIPEPVPGFPGWLRLVQANGEPSYYFHEFTRVTQWHHPEADPVPAYIPVTVRNTDNSPMPVVYGDLGLERSATERVRRPSAENRGMGRLFSNPEVVRPSKESFPSDRSNLTVAPNMHEKNDPEVEQDEVPLDRKPKQARRGVQFQVEVRDMGYSAILDDDHANDENTAEILAPSAETISPPAHHMSSAKDNFTHEPIDSKPAKSRTKLITTSSASSITQNHVVKPDDVQSQSPVSMTAESPKITRASSISLPHPPPPGPPPPEVLLKHRNSQTQRPGMPEFRHAGNHVSTGLRSVSAMKPQTPAPTKPATETLAQSQVQRSFSLRQHVQEWKDPHSEFRQAVNILLWIFLPVLPSAMRLIVVVFLLSSLV